MTNTPNKTSGREWLVTAPSDSDLQEGMFSYRAYRKESFPKHVWAKRIEQAKDAESGMFHVVDSEWRTQAMALAEALREMLVSHHNLYLSAFDYLKNANPEDDIQRKQAKGTLSKFEEWMKGRV